ncbi:MAG: energy-coupling factor transporter ATPase [Clostridiales bacterium]|nr:energy-coupling factor transporter ATPase [Clostridiales bacterium]
MSLEVRNLNYVYGLGTPMEKKALTDISFSIPKGQFLGIIGHTGSGKSTLIQHLNGLIRATSGEIIYDGRNIYEKDYPMKELRQKVGLVFQYPEYQLFEETVMKDVCFGPLNQGLSKEECEKRAAEALLMTGISEKYWKKSPFELSGGQKRRVAIAGVLAMQPDYLILDEPTAGLDPRGRDDILGQIRELHEKSGLGVVLVSHSMDDIAEYVERVIVIDSGKLRQDGTPREVFRHYKELEEYGLSAPQITYIMHSLRDKGIMVDTEITRVDEACEEILRVLGRKE